MTPVIIQHNKEQINPPLKKSNKTPNIREEKPIKLK